ncbi:carboxypeptidase regulatory-like domain-containing protein [Paraglaciecola sp. MB-3u-78]|jgi:hypothetical protein|uniref:carboxypeptidase regulatory-like domain-containing protein n=1 Tax=Paraglaciecola sp. MB-3u-78 TaxID=2058332 RepID=UPI000C333A43|nr:hypothetical protein CXF95_19835 [Paraglaciecola sp. MB-3u-78]
MYAKHSLREIEGIGLITADKLQAIGLFWAEDLLSLPLRSLKIRLRNFPELNRRVLLKFCRQAELLQVVDSGQFAEGLYSAGIRNLAKLYSLKPQTVVNAIDESIAKGLLKTPIDEATATEWQKLAIQYDYTGIVQGLLLSEDGQPIKQGTIYCKAGRAITANDGTFWLPGVRYGAARILIEAVGFKQFTANLKLSNLKKSRYRFTLIPGTDVVEEIDENSGQSIRRFDINDRIVQERKELWEIPEATLLHLSHRYVDGDVKLSTVHRIKKGNVITISTVRLLGEAVSVDDENTTVYQLQGGTLVKRSKSLSDYRLGVRYAGLLDAGYKLDDILEIQ